jgi:hypothetical protein
MMKPTTIYHGNVFGNGNWHTFHCGMCNRQIPAGATHCGCGVCVDWSSPDWGGKESEEVANGQA